MKNVLVISGHAIGESNFHVVLTPAYRRQVFRCKLTRELTIAYIALKLEELQVHLIAYDFGPDHLHLFVTNVRHVSEVELIRNIKGYSSFMLRRGHRPLFEDKLWGKKFWTYGHFYRSVGAVNKETVKQYVEQSQTKHWETTRQQQTLLAYH